MLRTTGFLALILLLAPLRAFAGPASDQLLAELNRVRADPRAYADELSRYRDDFEGLEVYPPGGTALLTQEGTSAVDDAIRFLRRQPALPPITLNSALSRSAASLAREQSQTGRLGHNGADGPNFADRIRRQGEWQGEAAEAISYGMGPAAEVIRHLIVDDGVPDRGHRTTLFNAQLRNAGAACEAHPTYVQVCVLDFATAMLER